MNHIYKNWVYGVDKQDLLSIAIHPYLDRLQADFLQLLICPLQGGTFRNCYTFSSLQDINHAFATQHKSEVESLNFNIEIRQIDKLQASRLFPPESYLRTMPFGHYIYVPIALKNQLTGIFCLYFKEGMLPSAAQLDEVKSELGLLLESLPEDCVTTRLSPELLDFSRELAFIKSRKQLMELFDRSLQAMLTYSYSTILILENETNNITNFLTQEQDLASGNSFVSAFVLKKWPPRHGYEGRGNKKSARLEQFDQTASVLPSLAMEEDKVNNAIIYNLYGGIDAECKWVIFFPNENAFRQANEGAMVVVANALTQTITQILTNERLQQADQEKDIIRSLNLDFSSARNKKDLLDIINLKLAKLLNFNYSQVILINEDETTVSPFLRDSDPRARNHPNFQLVMNGSYPILDGVYNKVLLSRDPLIFDLFELQNKGKLPEYLQFKFDCGVRKVSICSLQIRSKTIGFWIATHVEEHGMSGKQLELMKTISTSFSIAVDNIRANELIQARELEAEKLLQLNFDLSNVHKKEDLELAIHNNLPDLLEFEELFIVLTGSQGNESQFLATGFGSKLDKTIDRCCISMAYAKQHGEAWVTQEMDELAVKKDASEVLKNEVTRGIREKIIVNILLDDGRNAVLAIHFATKNSCKNDIIRLVRSIGYQLSFAVSNILAGEEIKKREEERDLLLALAISISAVKSDIELLGAINHHIKPILQFTHTCIADVDVVNQSSKIMLVDPDSYAKAHPDFGTILNMRHSLTDGILDVAYQADEPVLIELDELKRTQILPPYLLVNYESGITHVVIAKLSVGKGATRLWFLLYKGKNGVEKSRLDFVKGMANQIAAAQINIIANDHAYIRDFEKSRLIAFASHLAEVNDKHVLAKILAEQLRELFEIAGFVIFRIDADKTTLSPYVSHFDPGVQEHQDFPFTNSCPINKSIFPVILQNSGLVSFDLNNSDDKMEWPELVGFTKRNGFNGITGYFLRPGNDPVGVMLFWHKDSQFADSQGVIANGIFLQVGSIVSCLISNEIIKLQRDEIAQYKVQIENDKVFLTEELAAHEPSSEIVGNSDGMQKVFGLLKRVVKSDSTVLILGETGTGKELVARAIHDQSPRSSRQMVKINCAALPANLIESELFGHERGAFTGATERRLGKFELANHGTLFLDEIGEMPLELQVKLLRALQEKEIERVGGKTTIKVDVRIVAATNRDLQKEVEDGRFRRDLYYRLNIFPIELPPLRARRDDIPLLALHFINRYSLKNNKRITGLGNKALYELKKYDWPGNIRELEHTIERSVLLTNGEILKEIAVQRSAESVAKIIETDFIPYTIDENERIHIMGALKFCNGKINGKTGAADLLGVPASTLNSKMKRLNIRKEHIAN